MNNKAPESRVMLRRCMAIILRKEGCQGDPGDFWMYESGYLLFQGLVSANSVCWWNSALQGAARSLTFRGYVSPGALLLGSEPCSLEVIRGSWAKRVLQPPAGYQIIGIEDIEECFVSSISQTQWTPLPEAVCAVVLRLSSQGRPAGIESIREALILSFPHVSPPSERALYDTLVQLSAERKLYHTSKGYFIVTPEKRRSRSHSRGRRRPDDRTIKSMLLSTEEALILVHGEMTTTRDGDITHQCIQTNLADVICGGNSSDKILYARNNKRRSASFPVHRSPDRRGSFRLWGSSRRLRRSASTRTLAKHYVDSGSSTDYPNCNDCVITKKPSLLSRLFRRSKRSQCQSNTFSAQFPPMEWFNSKAIHLHSVATQTSVADKESALSIPYYFDNSEVGSTRSATLPRRHRRQLSSDSTCIITSYTNSREQSPSIKDRSPIHTSSTLPRSSTNLKNTHKSRRSCSNSKKTSYSSLSPKICLSNSDIQGDGVQRPNSGYSSLRDPTHTNTDHTRSLVPTSSLESINSHFTMNSCQNKKFHKLKQNSIPPSEVTTPDNDRPCKSPILDLSTAFKNSLSLDNSGPSSIESHKSSKTTSSITTGPSSLESQKTVINCLPLCYDGNTNNSHDSDLELKSEKLKKSEISKYYKTNLKSKVNESNILHSSSFTVQVTTNQGGASSNNSNNALTATINSGNTANTKIFVQNSPVRSVITFENAKHIDSNPNVVIINGGESLSDQNILQTTVTNSNNETEILDQHKTAKNTNFIGNTSLNNFPVVVDHTNRLISETMNNNRKLSLQLSPKEGLNYRNLLKTAALPSTQNQVCLRSNLELTGVQNFGGFTKNTLENNLPSSSKSYDNSCTSSGNIFTKCSDSKSCQKPEFGANCNVPHLLEKNMLGSEPNISYQEQDNMKKSFKEDTVQRSEFPSFSDLGFNFTSLAAQKILKGVSINSIDTLVELNTATVEKPNNCDIVHTDFGLL